MSLNTANVALKITSLLCNNDYCVYVYHD